MTAENNIELYMYRHICDNYSVFLKDIKKKDGVMKI